nr:immunoglobulin heavy chain junction region [Homo sapiens]MOP42935.1 immunoglobulin heavy chain junction region [Homo sapiens]
CARGLGSSSW